MNVSRHGISVSRRITRLCGVAVAGALVSSALLAGCATGEGTEQMDSDGPHTVLKKSIDLAQEGVLTSNISQIQMFIGMYRGDNDGKAPASMDELKHSSKFPAEMFVNPIDQKPLLYDPATGKVTAQPYNRGVDAPDLPKLPDGNAAGATSQ